MHGSHDATLASFVSNDLLAGIGSAKTVCSCNYMIMIYLTADPQTLHNFSTHYELCSQSITLTNCSRDVVLQDQWTHRWCRSWPESASFQRLCWFKNVGHSTFLLESMYYICVFFSRHSYVFLFPKVYILLQDTFRQFQHLTGQCSVRPAMIQCRLAQGTKLEHFLAHV